MTYITRRETFNAAHRLYNDHWSEERNDEVFGKCANRNWHGHNYALFVTVKGDPDPETLWHLEIFYNAIAVAIERETGQMVSPMMKMSHEGFGRMVLLAGRLVVVNKQLRDVHRFGFPSLAKLADAGSKFFDEAVSMIRTYPAVAQYGA